MASEKGLEFYYFIGMHLKLLNNLNKLVRLTGVLQIILRHVQSSSRRPLGRSRPKVLCVLVQHLVLAAQLLITHF